MNRRTVAMVAVPLAAMLSVITWAQVAVHGAGEPSDGPAVVTPSGAATVRTPGTPGASDTPGALAPRPGNDAPKSSSSPSDAPPKGKSKKHPGDAKEAPPK